MKRLAPNEILTHPSASDWLKDALRTALKRDAFVAMNDAEYLAQVLREQLIKKVSS